MKLHEYQAKQLFASVAIPIPRGQTAKTAKEARDAYETLARTRGGAAPFACSLKAQIHAGGRGKAGGVVTANSAQEAGDAAAKLLGKRLVTKQTGSEGLPVSAVLLEEQIAVGQERYLALTIDRFSARPMVLASRMGGMDIEDVAASQPHAIVQEPIDVVDGLTNEALVRLVNALDIPAAQRTTGQDIIQVLWKLFLSSDASLIEINPLVVTKDGQLLALDAKLVLDDNALFRHQDLANLRDNSQEHPLELEAGRIGISYVGLDGTIGCLVNGAGLAMATNDIIQLCGGRPANFLDVGGGANVDQVTNAFRIILSDARVKAILVNIFGGIMRCDWIAQGLLNATQQLAVKIPIVVRLQGTNVEEGRRLLKEASEAHRADVVGGVPSGKSRDQLNLISVDELEDAARKVVELSQR